MSKDISDATIVEETTTKDLLDQLTSKTEIKTPGASSAASSFWDKADASDFAPDPGPVRPPSPSPSADPKDPKDLSASAAGKLTKQQKEDSAKVAIGMLSMLNDLITKPVLNHKLNKKFTPEEIAALDLVMDKEEANLEGTEADLKRKWNRLIAKHDKKVAQVQIDEAEKKQMLQAFETYFDVTQKTMPPEWYLGFAALTFVGKRIIDISFD